ncbi:MAG: hypothetical protein ACE5KM_23375 [Planctomycetaceae bacterium]
MTAITPEDISTNATQPKAATVDGNSAQQHSIRDQIAAARFANSEDAKTNKGFGVRFSQLRNQGTA